MKNVLSCSDVKVLLYDQGLTDPMDISEHAANFRRRWVSNAFVSITKLISDNSLDHLWAG